MNKEILLCLSLFHYFRYFSKITKTTLRGFNNFDAFTWKATQRLYRIVSGCELWIMWYFARNSFFKKHFVALCLTFWDKELQEIYWWRESQRKASKANKMKVCVGVSVKIANKQCKSASCQANIFRNINIIRFVFYKCRLVHHALRTFREIIVRSFFILWSSLFVLRNLFRKQLICL